MGLKSVQFMYFGLFLVWGQIVVKAEDISVISSHTFTSDNYPSNYPSNYNETWCFFANSSSRLFLSFDEIQTEHTFDFIIVWESTTASGNTQLLRWSGSVEDEPPKVVSSGNNLCLFFQTDAVTEYKGFSGKVDVVRDSFQDSCSDGFDCMNGVCLEIYDHCNGLVNCGNGEDENCTSTTNVGLQHDFSSMNYDNGGYVRNHHFTWYFESNSGMELLLNFSNIDFEEDSPFDLILVGEGLDTSRNQLLSWHGDVPELTPVMVRSSGPSLWVQLQTDESKHGRGFAASVQSISSQTANECPHPSVCGNGVCIPSNATCDGYQHCANGNDEDGNCPDRCGGDMPCSDGMYCFSELDRCDAIPICFKYDDESDCETEEDVDTKVVRQYRDFSQTINFKTNVKGSHLLINLFFLRTESRDVEVNLTVGENELTSAPLLTRNGSINDYVLTQRSSGKNLWLKFSVRGTLAISVNVVKEAPSQPLCPDDMAYADGNAPPEWTEPFCDDFEDGQLTSSCSPSSGENFEIGENIVTCTCNDTSTLTSSCSFTVTRQQTSIDVLQIPLFIGLAVVAILVVLIVAFLLTSRIGKGRRKSNRNGRDTELEPINQTPVGGAVGIDNPMRDRGPEPSPPTSTAAMYQSIDERNEQPPNLENMYSEADVNNVRQGSDYSRGLYNGDNIPRRPSRPGGDVDQASPYYSTKLQSSSQDM